MRRIKKLIICISLCILSLCITAQNQSPTLSHAGLFEQVYDKDGNAYLLEDLVTDPLKPSNMGGGPLTDCGVVNYFAFEFDNGSGFEDATNLVHLQRRAVLCHVLENLSRFIIPVNQQNLVRIRMRNFNLMGYTQTQGDSILASATSFSAYPQPVDNLGGILDNLIWKTINSGQDAYSDISNMVIPTNQGVSFFIYHGQCTVNFRDEDDVASTYNTDPIHWNLNDSAAPQFTEFDLYSVLLHEMMHALGFDSNILADGTSQYAINPYFTRYDSYLRKPMVNGQFYPLLADPGEPCSMYTSLWNSQIATTSLNPNCTTLGEFNVDCTTAIQFGGTLNQGIYNPGCYAIGSSLAHMSDLCDDEVVTEFEHYLMAPSFPNSVMRRFPQEEERTILCNLGYHVADRFGFSDTVGTGTDDVLLNEIDYETESCGGNQVVGINDGISETGAFTFVSYGGDPINLSGTDLLGNDYFPVAQNMTFECLELIVGNGELSVNGNTSTTSGDLNSVISLDPEFENGVFILRYIPVFNGIRGNITYVFAGGNSSVPPFNMPYYSYGECLSNACDLIHNGDFEADAMWCSHQCRPNQSHQDEITCWTPFGNPVIRSAYFTRNAFVVDTNNVSYNCTGPNNIHCRPINQQPFAGINSNTRSNPPCDTYNSDPANNAFVFIGAEKLQSPPVGVSSVMSGRFRSGLSTPLIPGAQYLLSYYAKVLNSNLEDSLSNHLIDELVANDLYHSGNVEAKVRFLIDNREQSVDFVNLSNSMLTMNTALFDSTIVLAEPEPIPPVGPNPTSTSDWHYREVIVQIPDTLSNDYQNIIIEYNIWDTPYLDILTGFFIDDVSLRQYFGPVVIIPDTICSTITLNNLDSYILSPGIEGNFTCPTCAIGSIGTQGNSFHADIAGAGEHVIVFTYTNGTGCQIVENHPVLVDNDGCCTILIEVDEVSNTCPDGENGKIYITASEGVGSYTYAWNGASTSTDEDLEDLAPGTYTVVVTDENECQATATVEITILPVVDLAMFTTQAQVDLLLNGQEVFMANNLVFGYNPNPAEGTLLLEDCSIYFSTNLKMIVEEGAGIAMESVDLDACDNSWKGITLMSSSALASPLPAGAIKGGNFVSIKHAVIAIDTKDFVSSGNLGAFQCGSMLFTNSTFSDNLSALTVNRGNGFSTGPLWGIEFTNCTFEWTEDMINHFPNFYGGASVFPQYRMVYMNRYKGARFVDCMMQNLTTQDIWERRFTGYHLSSSRVEISSSDGLNPVATVTGFNSGIRGLAEQIYYTGTIVHDLTFRKNKVAYRNEQVSNIRIYRNTMHVGESTGIAGLDDAETKYEGISLFHCTGFEVSENHIFGHISSVGKLTDEDTPYTVGITTASTVSANEEIYKNDFHNLNWANVANGNNNSTATNGGLRYVCNTNTGNNYDFVVADFPLSSGAQIGEVQTDYASPSEPSEKAAGNTFTQGNTGVFNDFWNETQVGGITYRYFFNGSQIPSSYNSDLFFPEPFGFTNTCATEISLFNDPSGNTSNAEIANWQAHKLQSRNAWLTTRYLWKSLIDGGSTEELQSEIENAYTGTTWLERQKLLDFSPYLTHTVLTEVADNTLVFPHPVALEIFLANPDVLTDKPLMDHLSLKADPMPEYMIDILSNSSNQITARTILEDELRTKQSIYLDAAQKVFRARLSDPAFTIEDQVEELKQWKNLSSEYQIIEYYMEQGDHETALERYDQIAEICDLNREGNKDYEAFYEWLNLKRAIYDNEQYMESLSSAFVEQLQLLADTYPYSYAGTQAMLVMNEYYGGEYELEPFVPMEETTPKFLRQSKKVVEVNMMNIFPNPASDLLNIQLALPELIFRPGRIEISDASGRLVKSLSVQYFNQSFTLNLNDWKSGTYNIALYTSDKIVEFKKVDVIR